MHLDVYKRQVRELGLTDGKSFGKGSRIIKYEYDMPAVLAAADLIICRAGAVKMCIRDRLKGFQILAA